MVPEHRVLNHRFPRAHRLEERPQMRPDVVVVGRAKCDRLGHRLLAQLRIVLFVPFPEVRLPHRAGEAVGVIARRGILSALRRVGQAGFGHLQNPLRFQGSKGILEMTESGLTYTPQIGKDSAPSYYANSFPRAMREAYFRKWHEENDPKLGQERMSETITFRAPDYDDVRPHLWTFFEAVRSRKPVVEDAVFGHHAALACHMANESYFRGNAVSWDAASTSIKS